MKNTSQDTFEVRRGDLFFADLNPVVGSEQGGRRPVVVLQNDIGNQYSPTTIVAAITSRLKKAKLPTHVEIKADKFNLAKNSVVLLEQLRTIDKKRLGERIGHFDEETMSRVDLALLISLGLKEL